MSELWLYAMASPSGGVTVGVSVPCSLSTVESVVSVESSSSVSANKDDSCVSFALVHPTVLNIRIMQRMSDKILFDIKPS